MEDQVWRKCTTCKKPLAYGSNYLVCSVSTCNTKRAAMVFCGLQCWDAHLPVMNHREAFWEQKKAPKSLAEALALENQKKEKPKAKVEEIKPSNTNKIIVRRKPT